MQKKGGTPYSSPKFHKFCNFLKVFCVLVGKKKKKIEIFHIFFLKTSLKGCQPWVQKCTSGCQPWEPRIGSSQLKVHFCTQGWGWQPQVQEGPRRLPALLAGACSVGVGWEVTTIPNIVILSPVLWNHSILVLQITIHLLVQRWFWCL